jgi:hypothetical protein
MSTCKRKSNSDKKGKEGVEDTHVWKLLHLQNTHIYCEQTLK